MNQDNDLELGDIDDVSVDEQPRRPRAGGRDGGRSPSGGDSGRGTSRGGGTPPGSGGSGDGRLWKGLTLALVVLVLGGGGFLGYQLVDLRSKMETELARSTDQLSRLSRELYETDETLLESWDELEDRLDFQMSEIRKLWAVSNERNRDWIEENQSAIKTLRGERGELAETVGGLEEELARVWDQLGGVREAVEQARLAQNQMETRVELVRESMSELEGRMDGQLEAMDRFEQLMPRLEGLARLQEQEQGLGERLEELEAAIAAFDSYRRQVNTRLDRLEEGG